MVRFLNGVRDWVWRPRGWRRICGLVAGVVGLAGTAHAALQFDVFAGYDGLVPEASWFPIVCEIKNDGPTFTGTIEVDNGNFSQGQMRRLTVELPTGTLKRVVLPVFATSRGYGVSWDVRLRDERDRVRAEQTGLRPRRQVGRGTTLVGALSRTPGGAPSIRPILSKEADLQPVSARLLPAIFPDNPLVLEGMDCVYLNSERAADLSAGQVAALFAWLNAGGHLIVAVEQPADVTASPWLKGLCPCEPRDLRTLTRHAELQEWLRSGAWPTNFAYPNGPHRNQFGQMKYTDLEQTTDNPFSADKLPSDFDFEAASMQVAVGDLREGTVEVAAGDIPLVVTTARGRGRVTMLLFSPEREPLRSWKNLPTFWSRVTEVPLGLYVSGEMYRQGGMSSDGIFGGMIDTRQVHKLPVWWLLLLLLIYLVVIGPLDQMWLKRIGRPMLTWITFPCYVVVFSLVIYFIGYKLRAGESEWNDLHVVDVLTKGESAELRGRTYSSVYSPSNQRYRLESQQQYATLRGEFAGMWGGQSTEKAVIEAADNFKADVFVPVWTSELLVCDWWQPAPVPLAVSVHARGNGWQVQVENRTSRRMTNVQMVVEDRIVGLGDLGPLETRTNTVTRDQGTTLNEFVGTHGAEFQQVVRSRQAALGSSEQGQISDVQNATIAASFLSVLAHHETYEGYFITPPGLDLSSLAKHGNAVVFAWAPDYAPVKPIYRFTPKRTHQDTMWRVAAPVL